MNKKLLKHILIPAVGFGIGGIILGVFNGINMGNFSQEFRDIIWGIFGITMGKIVLDFIGGSFFGLMGIFSLGFFYNYYKYKENYKILFLFLLTIISFGIGNIIWNSKQFTILDLLFGYTLGYPGYIIGAYLIPFFIGGVIIGTLLSLSFFGKIIKKLAISSAIGFSISGIIGILIASSIKGVESFIVYGFFLGVIGGGWFAKEIYNWKLEQKKN